MKHLKTYENNDKNNNYEVKSLGVVRGHSDVYEYRGIYFVKYRYNYDEWTYYDYRPFFITSPSEQTESYRMFRYYGSKTAFGETIEQVKNLIDEYIVKRDSEIYNL